MPIFSTTSFAPLWKPIAEYKNALAMPPSVTPSSSSRFFLLGDGCRIDCKVFQSPFLIASVTCFCALAVNSSSLYLDFRISAAASLASFGLSGLPT